MIKSNTLRRGRTCVFLMHVHLVFVTKYRRKLFSKSALKDLREIFGSICNDFEATLKECDGEKDHIHLLVEYHPKVSVSKIVNSLKGVSSRMIRQKYPKIRRYLWNGSLWSSSYFAGSCGGAPLSIIKDYIQKQSNPKN